MGDLSEKIEQLRELLVGGGVKRAVIIPHISPDGDAIGSCGALSLMLDKLGIHNQIIICDHVPDYLQFLPKAKSVISNRTEPELCESYMMAADALFMMDHNNPDREGELQPLTEAFMGKKVMIDHHLEPSPVDITISDSGSPATCMLLFQVIKSIWGKEAITPDMANALYAGISTDTGNFNHAASDPELYRTVADLLEQGLNRDYVYSNIYQVASLDKLKLTGSVILNDLRIHPDYPVAIIPITLQELEQYNYKEGDLEGVVNIPLSIAAVKVSVMITERKDKVKLSMRSKGDIPVNLWCEKYFNGGGHKNASGGKMEIPFAEVVELVYGTVEEFFEGRVTN